jgi:hypothetical protein
MLSVLDGPRYSALLADEASRLLGGDEYDDYALCDGTNNCVACTPPTCVAGAGGVCVVDTAGNDGCANANGTDSYCNSFSAWSDCEYKGGVQVCGGPANRRACKDQNYPACLSWGDGKSGCQAGTSSVEQCQNCATIP